MRFPALARADTGVRAGDEISPWYDPMIAKVIVHGRNRGEALQKLRAALAQTELAGTVTNLAFLKALARHEGFAAGDVDTGLIDRDLATLGVEPQPCSRSRALAALAVLGLTEAAPLQGFALWSPLRQIARLTHAGAAPDITVETLGPGRFRVTEGDTTHQITRGAGWAIDGASVAANVVAHGAGVSVFWGNAYHFERIDPLAVGGKAPPSGRTLAPMPGLVKAVFVAPGAVVAAGDRLAILRR